jgi:serine/threonine-protein kinase
MTPPAHSLSDTPALLAAVQASGLLTAAELAHAAAAMPPEAGTASAAARFLVAAGFLTDFQAERLLAGRTDGFILGPYVILEQIGRGSVGRVYKAWHRSLERLVAIKMLRPEATRTEAARARFAREVRAAARLNHPNIVTAYDTNEVGERSYLVMEFVDGPTFAALVHERGPLPVAEACELVRQVAVGLQHAHEQGMVHRDVKPHNLLVGPASVTHPGGVVKVADFGIARLKPARPPAARDPGPPRTGLLGTPDYLAPEQAHNPHSADHRADLYSLGCVFHFLLTGRPPFPDGTPQEKVLRHQFEAPTPVGRLRPDVPQTVAEIVGRLLAKDPNGRFQSAAAVAARLDGLAAGAVAGDDGVVVSFELPAVPVTPYSQTSGGLTGMNAGLAADTCPWSQLTDETPTADMTFGPARAATPIGPPAARPKPRGPSIAAVLAACGGVLVGCVLALGVLVRALAR